MIPDEYSKYEKTVTVTVVNFANTWGNKAANIAKMKQMVGLAAQFGSNIILFPEMSLSGSECGEDVGARTGSCRMHREAAEPIPGPSTLELADLAKKLSIYIIVGMPELNTVDSSIHNSAAVIGPEGILGKYRKIHVSPPPNFTEQYCIKPGLDLPVFQTKYGPIGVLICADFWYFPELARILWLKGARILFNPSATPGNRQDLVTWETATRASERLMFTATANMVGMDRTKPCCGYSTIAGPDFPRLPRVFVQCTDKDEMATATLNFERLHYHRNLLGIQKRLALDLVAREYGALAKGRY